MGVVIVRVVERPASGDGSHPRQPTCRAERRLRRLATGMIAGTGTVHGGTTEACHEGRQLDDAQRSPERVTTRTG